MDIQIDKKDILKLPICIWGTGKYGKKLFHQLEEYIPICREVFRINIMDNVKYFIDNDIEKQKSKLYDKEIKSSTYFFQDTIHFCVTAMLDRKEVCQKLERNGFQKGVDYLPSELFIEVLKEEILKKREQVFCKYGLDFLWAEESLENILAAIRKIYKQLSNEIGQIDNIQKYVIFSIIIDKWKDSTNKKEDFILIQKYFENAFLVAAFAWYYGNNIIDIVEGNCKDREIVIEEKEKQTIGIIVFHYYGGGIEKTVSLLLPLFIAHGHKVVLITDDYAPEKEYNIPKEVYRHVMVYKMDGCIEGRLKELIECVKKYKIDIMCFHSGYSNLPTFYDMWCMKLQGIAVLMEIHSAFFPIIMEKKEVSKYYSYMYRIADKVIVLSSTDKVFWENLGCNCFYIQNPIEIVTDNQETITHRTKTIVWVGRLVKVPKNIFDVVPIMKEVVKEVPDAVLKIVGLPGNQFIYDTLMQLMIENKLTENIELCGYNPNIDQVYREADIVLMTSSSESFCNVVMESKVRGIPMVMYELPWLELLKDGQGYIAVKQRDTYAAANAVIKLLKDTEYRDRKAREARESIDPFIKHDVYKDWKEVFDSVIKKEGRKESVNLEFSIIEHMLLSAICEK